MCEHGTLVEVDDLLAYNGEWYRRTWKVDACLASLVRALNLSGTETIGSCCGHGTKMASILVKGEARTGNSGTIPAHGSLPLPRSVLRVKP